MTLHRVRLAATAALLVSAPAGAQSGAPSGTQPVVLTLGGAARWAAEKNAGPAAARERVAQADARVRQQRASFMPTLTASALDHENNLNSATFPFSFNDPTTGVALFDPNGEVLGPVKNWDMRGNLRQDVVDLSAFAKLRAAHAGVTASEAQAAAAAQQAAGAAAVAYVRAVRADAQITARLADSTLAAELLGIARDQLAAGVGVVLDVTRAQAQLSLTHSQLIAARAERDRARIDLTRTLNLPVGTAIVLADSLGALPSETGAPAEDAAVAQAERSRADLRAAAEQAAAAERQLDAVRAERYPALSLFADQGVNGKNVDHLLNTYNWGIALSVPVFDGFRREGRIDEQRAALRELDVRRRDLSEQAAADV
ncbi:MAG TPA: TolC family protein, partial [Gemmatimonadaceae bacterium]|nr:TolC family protein [Gemmatimonadaceae bacterium]